MPLPYRVLSTELGDNPPDPDGAHRIDHETLN